MVVDVARCIEYLGEASNDPGEGGVLGMVIRAVRACGPYEGIENDVASSAGAAGPEDVAGLVMAFLEYVAGLCVEDGSASLSAIDGLARAMCRAFKVLDGGFDCGRFMLAVAVELHELRRNGICRIEE